MLVRAVLEGMIGAVGYLFFVYYNDNYIIENPKKKLLTRAVLGALVGYIWAIRGLPNSFNTLMAGALAPEIIDTFLEKFETKIEDKI